ncbi:MAG: MFS transporter [Actinomycetota bacterium]
MREGTLQRARGALRSPDFRRLFAIRLASQFADGLFQASLIASVVFSPEEQSTTVGFFKASLIVALPFSVIGPFTGVFIDRWSRRRILVVAPWVKVAAVGLVLFDADRAAVAFYAGALIVLSANRFFLATAQAVVPRLVPTADLLIANSMATVGGTVSLLLGVFVGGKAVDAEGAAPAVVGAGLLWLLGSWIASRIRSELAPHALPEDPELLRHELRRVGVEFADGIGRLWRSPRALGPITSITLDQVGQGVVLVLSLFVFRDRFGEGVGSFSNLIGAGGAGVLLGVFTVGMLEDRFPKERIVAGSFFLGGVTIVAVAFHITGWSVLIASFVVGITFAWKKIPVDTMVQGSMPDGYRGRVFAVYDVAYNLARLLAAGLAIPMLPGLGVTGSVAAVGIVFLLWTPVLPRWIARHPEIRLRSYAGGRADETPRAIVWGGVEEPVEVLGSWREVLDDERRLRFRLALADGTVLDISRAEPDGDWRIDREGDVGHRSERSAPDDGSGALA